MTDEAMQIWTQARRDACRFGADWKFLPAAAEDKAAAVIAEALAERDARIEQLEAALRPFIDAIGRINLSREYGENRVEIHWGKARATAVTVASFTQALAALETKHG